MYNMSTTPIVGQHGSSQTLVRVAVAAAARRQRVRPRTALISERFNAGRRRSQPQIKPVKGVFGELRHPPHVFLAENKHTPIYLSLFP